VRVAWLPDPKHFKLFAACVLLYIGGKLIRELLGKQAGQGGKTESEKRFQEMIRNRRQSGSFQTEQSVVRVTRFNLKRLGYTFHGESFDVSFWGLFSLSFIVGIVGGIYGIGGGAIIAPFLVTFFGLPVYTVAGAALMGTFVTSVAGVAFYQAIAPFYPDMSVAPDWTLGFLFGLGGLAGMYLGARCQKFVPASKIKWMLAGIIVFTALKYGADFFR
ncbi:MAG: sulfite exporter TauE/SafE family protein, partial [Desulfovibrionales bacterium]